jgi:lipoprotein Spr
MLKRSLSILTIFTFLTITKTLAQSVYVEPLINEFFCKNGIAIDSCSYDALYTEAYQWIDTPYRYSGNSDKGIDCSGLTKKLYEKVYNLKLQGGSRTIYDQIIPIKNKTDLREGDLVFFKISRNQISHVGVYLQDGNFIHASVRSGVIISNLSEPYYQKYYFSGGRFPE